MGVYIKTNKRNVYYIHHSFELTSLYIHFEILRSNNPYTVSHFQCKSLHKNKTTNCQNVLHSNCLSLGLYTNTNSSIVLYNLQILDFTFCIITPNVLSLTSI